jgi:hypothetical protein
MGTLAFPSLDAAIAQAEGYNTAGSIPNLANNPGDLVAGPFATAHGATGSITAAGGQQIAVFPAGTNLGAQAEDDLIANNYTGGSIQDLATSWLSGSSPATQTQWANNVSTALGVPASTPVTSLAGGTASPAATGVAAPSTSPSLTQQAMNAVTSGNLASFVLFGVPVTRAAAFILGLIVIAGAIYLFKPVQKVVNTTIKRGAEVAGGAAAVAAV